jgi:hypothetical protein
MQRRFARQFDSDFTSSQSVERNKVNGATHCQLPVAFSPIYLTIFFLLFCGPLTTKNACRLLVTIRIELLFLEKQPCMRGSLASGYTKLMIFANRVSIYIILSKLLACLLQNNLLCVTEPTTSTLDTSGCASSRFTGSYRAQGPLCLRR